MDDDGGDDESSGGGGDGSIAGSCEDIGPETLDRFVPGLEPVESVVDIELADLNCDWELEQGEFGAVTLSLQAYQGEQFYGEDLYEETDMTSVDLCDRAFVTEDFGLSLQTLDGDQVLVLSSTQLGTDDEDRMDVDEGIGRLTDLATALTGC